MKRKYCFIDAEYNGTSESILNLVSSSFKTSESITVTRWLHKLPYTSHAEEISKIAEDHIFVSFNVEAEARYMLALGLDPIKFNFIDLFLEYRCITNHSELMYGPQLIKGRIKRTTRPSYYSEDDEDNSKPEHSLAAACYKMLGVQVDTTRKDQIRDLIISSPDEFTEQEKAEILSYNESDIKYLEKLLIKIVKFYQTNLSDQEQKTLFDEMLVRGNYAARTAKMVSIGYPIDYEGTKNFSSYCEAILSDLARDVNSQFPEEPLFYFNWKEKRFSVDTKAWKRFVASTTFQEKWARSKKTKDYSLETKQFEKFFNFQHDYPRGNKGAQILRYLKTKKSLNGFRVSPNSKKKTFWEYVGSDHRVRPYLNIYGSMTSRTQPSATSFIPLKSAWMRALIMPPPGRAIASIDYSSVEFLISAIWSRCVSMYEAYKSGDVYSDYGRRSGIMPVNGNKHTNPIERQQCKPIVLGMSYDMTKHGLSHDLSMKFGREVTEDEAQEYIDKFEEAYPQLFEKKDENLEEYEVVGHLKLQCGWYLWGENDNQRSVNNFKIQGMCAAIMRKAVCLCQDAGLDVIFTLHDAVYIEYNSFDYKALQTFERCLYEAFLYYYKGTEDEEWAKSIGMEMETWSPDYELGWKEVKQYIKDCKVESIHIDERALNDYKKFKKYFTKTKAQELL